MGAKHGLLVAVDDSVSAKRALEYVVHLLEGRDDYRVRLLHLLPPVPPRLLEHGGAESGEAEVALEEGLRAQRDRWIAEREEEAAALFERARAALAPAVDPATVEAECRPSVDAVAVARDCVEAAKAASCGTIVLGRGALPWYRELFHRHPAEELVRHAKGLTVWVVE